MATETKVTVKLRDKGSSLKGKPISIHTTQEKTVVETDAIRKLVKDKILVVVSREEVKKASSKQD